MNCRGRFERWKLAAIIRGEPVKSQHALDANLKEELADVLDQVLILSDKFGIDPESLLEQSERKLTQRFKRHA